MQEQEHSLSKQEGAKKALMRSQQNLKDKLESQGLKIPLYPTPQIIERARKVMGGIDYDPTSDPIQQVLVGTLACVRAGLRSSGATEFAVPDSVRMPLEDLRRWSRVLQAGIAAETVVFGQARGGADDRALLGRLWGLSGHDVATAQREQRRARREIEQQLRQQRQALDQQAGALLEAAPRLGR